MGKKSLIQNTPKNKLTVKLSLRQEKENAIVTAASIIRGIMITLVSVHGQHWLQSGKVINNLIE
jgi:hypothetical protein